MTKSCIEDNNEDIRNTPWQKLILLVSFPLIVGIIVIALTQWISTLADLESYYWALILSTSYGVWITIKWVVMRHHFLNARSAVWFREDQLTRERKQQEELKELYYILLGKNSPLNKKGKDNSSSDEDDDEDSMITVESELPYKKDE